MDQHLMDQHSDWGTPGGTRYWYAERFEEDAEDRKALASALVLGGGLAALMAVVAATGLLI